MSVLTEAVALVTAAQVVERTEILDDALRAIVDATRQPALTVDEAIDSPLMITVARESSQLRGHLRVQSVPTVTLMQWLVHHAAARRLAADTSVDNEDETEEATAAAR